MECRITGCNLTCFCHDVIGSENLEVVNKDIILRFAGNTIAILVHLDAAGRRDIRANTNLVMIIWQRFVGLNPVKVLVHLSYLKNGHLNTASVGKRNVICRKRFSIKLFTELDHYSATGIGCNGPQVDFPYPCRVVTLMHIDGTAAIRYRFTSSDTELFVWIKAADFSIG